MMPRTRLPRRTEHRDVRRTSALVISLGDVAHLEQTVGPQSGRRLERQRNALLTVYIAQAVPLETTVERVENEVFPAVASALGPTYSLRVGGSAESLRQTLAALSSGFGLSILIIYLLLVALFRS